MLAPLEEGASAEQLLSTLRDSAVEALECPPIVLNQLAHLLARSSPAVVQPRLIVAGSEAWLRHDSDLLRKAVGGDTHIINTYGVTEASIDSM